MQYFGYSLENRIKPRYKKLKDKAIATSLASMLACVDLDFNTCQVTPQLGPLINQGVKLEGDLNYVADKPAVVRSCILQLEAFDYC